MRLWVPAFTWRDDAGKAHYDVHGVLDTLVSNRVKRKGIEGDFCSVFMCDVDEHPEKKRAKFQWVGVDVPDPGRQKPRMVERYFCCDGACEGHVLSGEACYP